MTAPQLVCNDGDFFVQLESALFTQPLAVIVRRLAFSRELDRAWRLIETGYRNPDLTLKKAAAECGASSSQLNRLMKSYSGFTFYQLLIRYRLFRAVERMTRQDLNFLELALESGFGSVNSFARDCRNLLGLKPKELRQRCRREALGLEGGPRLVHRGERRKVLDESHRRSSFG